MDSEGRQTTLNPETWVDRYADYLYNYAISRVGDEDIAKDIVQDTFVAALQASKSFKGNAAERT
ncbi:MAG: sigma factor, partial [Robiginitalea sp.]